MLKLTNSDLLQGGIKKGACGQKAIFNIGGEKYFFKPNYINNSKKYTHQNNYEVFMSYLLNKFGVKNILKYDYAQYDNGQEIVDGCVSKSFLTPDVVREMDLLTIMEFVYYTKKSHQILDLQKTFTKNEFDDFYKNKPSNYKNALSKPHHFTVDEICQSVQDFCKLYKIDFNIKEIKQNLLSTVVIDYFCCNDDRNWQNIDFLLCDNNGKLTLKPTPIYDNAFALGAWYINNKTLEELEPMYKYVWTIVGISNLTQPEGFDLSIKGNKTLSNMGHLALDIWDIAQRDASIKDLVNKFKSLNLRDEMAQFEKEYNVSIDDSEKGAMDTFFEERKKHYQKRENKMEKLIQNSLDKA